MRNNTLPDLSYLRKEGDLNLKKKKKRLITLSPEEMLNDSRKEHVEKYRTITERSGIVMVIEGSSNSHGHEKSKRHVVDNHN